MFSNTWAVGLAWNIHNESFIQDLGFINYFKIRASLGNPGNQNFDPYIPYKTYTYNIDYQNIFGPSAVISKFGNKNLEWQRARDLNLGFDLSLFNNRLKLAFNGYKKEVNPMLLTLSIPISTGTSSTYTNLGGLKNIGYNATIIGTIISTPNVIWNVNYNFGMNFDEYFGIGAALASQNDDKVDASDVNNSTSFNIDTFKDTDILKRYYDGASANDLYAVKSLGIDPASGFEVFCDKNGNPTFTYNVEDEVNVGNSMPDIQGIVGSSFSYKNFDFSVNFRYSLGADVMASALFSKVENIRQSDLEYNHDKRALYDRWQKPGDYAKFTDIKGSILAEPTPMSSRFVMEENFISLESLSATYRVDPDFLKKYRIQGFSISTYMNDLFRISNIKEERGLDYPFARSMTVSLRLSF